MRSVEELSVRVRAQGGKVTAQRVILWRALAGDRTHPTAEELYARLRPHLPGLSLTTLYKALNELVEWGELRRFDIGDGHIHFDPDLSSHAELVCMRCHAIVDAPRADPLPPLPARLEGYQIVARCEQFYGYCPACQAATPLT